MSMTREDAIRRLAEARKRDGLTLYLGAGVSVGNGLPNWDRLVLAMYFSVLQEDVRAHPNYLFAIAEWHLERAREPLDITARKIRNLFEDRNEFLGRLRQTLYAGFSEPATGTFQQPSGVTNANRTLDAVVRLCGGEPAAITPVRSIISYNYDCLAELALADRAQPLWKAHQDVLPGRIPVYHVHGYVPLPRDHTEEGSTPDEIVFTEEQYHLAAQDAYSWSNLVQIQALSSRTGLMIGLSLSDRNLRRLLDAVRKTPERCENYALLQRCRWPKPEHAEVLQIDQLARKYSTRFEASGSKQGGKKFEQIESLIDQVESMDYRQEEAVLEELGVNVIWYDDHAEIPPIVDRIVAQAEAAAGVAAS